jgi:hypothetical protein
MSLLDLIELDSLHGHGMFAGVAREIAAVAKQRAAAAPKDVQQIASATMFAFDKLLRKHLVRTGQTAPVDAAWGGANALVGAVKDTFDASDEQTSLLTDLARYITAQNAAKLQSELTSARIKEEFPIEEELAKAMLPLPAPKAKGVKREQEDAEDSESELQEEHFTFDLPMPKLYAHFKKLKTEIAELAPAAGLTARVDALQRAVNQLVDVKLDEEIDALKTQLEKMDKRIAKLEKK